MLSESQNTEYKESWRDEYLKWICGSQMNVADFVAERDAVNTQKLADVFRVSRKTNRLLIRFA